MAKALVQGICVHLPGMLVLTLLVRDPCRKATIGGTPPPPPPNHSAGNAGMSMGGLDRQIWEVVGKWFCVFVVSTTVGAAVMGVGGGIMAYVCTYVFGAIYLLPRAAARWLEEGGGGGQQGHRQRARELASFSVRVILFAVPVVLLQIFLSVLLGVMSAQQLSFVYPYVLSFVEYVIVSKVLNDHVVEGHSDEALSIVGRFFVGMMESGRVGLLVVTYTTGAGTFQGLVLATLNSALVEVLSRVGVLSMMRQALKVQFRHGCGGCFNGTRPPFRLLPLTTLGKFRRVYLGCKTDAECWPVYMLAVVGMLDYGMLLQAHDPATGELIPALRCGVDVLVVVGGARC